MSRVKETTVKKAKLDEENISAYVSLSYDALRELLEALCILHGFKVLSHACIAELLNEYIEDFDYHGFNELRRIRNDINYYGEKVLYGEGKQIVKKIFTLKQTVKDTYFNSD